MKHGMGTGRNGQCNALDRLEGIGYRTVWMEDFGGRVVLVNEPAVALIDQTVPPLSTTEADTVAACRRLLTFVQTTSDTQGNGS